MSVVEAVTRDLERFPEDLRGSGLAAVALELAAQLDGENSATSKSMCARSLQDVLVALRAQAPVKREKDHLDELKQRRRSRLGGSASADSVGS